MFEAMIKPFAVISGGEVKEAIRGRERELATVIANTYAMHHSGLTVNPPSYFLRFPDRPDFRIIALPSAINDRAGAAGIKWISSVPENTRSSVPRASAVVILNDLVTGFPYACLEGSVISASRTASSAVLAADILSRQRFGGQRPVRIGFVGTGLIAGYIQAHFAGTGWKFDEIGAYDLSASRADRFSASTRETFPGTPVVRHHTAANLIRSCDLVVFATIAGRPHILEPQLFRHNPLVLHISLRDLSPEIILSSANVVDDIGHCLRERTSPHLAEMAVNNRDFISGTLGQVMADETPMPDESPVIFSPFGLGVLDLALGKWVYDRVVESGDVHAIPDFFAGAATI